MAGSLLLVLSVAGLAGCGDDADEVGTGAEPTGGGTTLEDCAGLLPDSVLDTLGWAGGTPGVDLGTCTLSGDDGDVSVQRRPVSGTTQGVLAERCTDYDDVDWVAGAAGQCGVVGPDELDLGVLVVDLDGETVLEAVVNPRTPTDPEAVRAALVEVVEAAASAL